jgi:hypothetical protein
LYPYFRFLGAHWAEDREEFSKQFGNITKVRDTDTESVKE